MNWPAFRQAVRLVVRCSQSNSMTVEVGFCSPIKQAIYWKYCIVLTSQLCDHSNVSDPFDICAKGNLFRIRLANSFQTQSNWTNIFPVARLFFTNHPALSRKKTNTHTHFRFSFFSDNMWWAHNRTMQ